MKKRRISHRKSSKTKSAYVPAGNDRMDWLGKKQPGSRRERKKKKRGKLQGRRAKGKRAEGITGQFHLFIFSRNARSPKLRLKVRYSGGEMHQEVSYSSETVGPGRPRAKGRCGKQVLFPGGNRGTGRGRVPEGWARARARMDRVRPGVFSPSFGAIVASKEWVMSGLEGGKRRGPGRWVDCV